MAPGENRCLLRKRYGRGSSAWPVASFRIRLGPSVAGSVWSESCGSSLRLRRLYRHRRLPIRHWPKPSVGLILRTASCWRCGGRTAFQCRRVRWWSAAHRTPLRNVHGAAVDGATSAVEARRSSSPGLAIRCACDPWSGPALPRCLRRCRARCRRLRRPAVAATGAPTVAARVQRSSHRVPGVCPVQGRWSGAQRLVPAGIADRLSADQRSRTFAGPRRMRADNPWRRAGRVDVVVCDDEFDGAVDTSETAPLAIVQMVRDVGYRSTQHKMEVCSDTPRPGGTLGAGRPVVCPVRSSRDR